MREIERLLQLAAADWAHALLLSSSAQHPGIKLTFSDEDEIIVGL